MTTIRIKLILLGACLPAGRTLDWHEQAGQPCPRRLQIARFLQVPVEFFYEGAPLGPDPGGPINVDRSSRAMTDFLATSEGLELVKAFMAVKDAKVRRRIIDMAKAVASREE